jgi:hypothetical protein
MSQSTFTYTICNQCGGAIPAGADAVLNIAGALMIDGVVTNFPGMDFCCSAHLAEWVGSQPQVATPDPPYTAPEPPPVHPNAVQPDPVPLAPQPTPATQPSAG